MIKHLIVLKAANVPLGMSEILGMWIRRSLSKEFVHAAVLATHADLPIPLQMLEVQSLAGGNPEEMVRAALIIRKAGAAPDFRQLAALDLMPDLDLAGVATAFANAVQRFPDLDVSEFMNRAAGREDVIAQVRDGSFTPHAHSQGWIVRVDSRAMSGVELAQLIHEGKLPETAQIKAPNEEVWLSREQAARRLGATR